MKNYWLSQYHKQHKALRQPVLRFWQAPPINHQVPPPVCPLLKLLLWSILYLPSSILAMSPRNHIPTRRQYSYLPYWIPLLSLTCQIPAKMCRHFFFQKHFPPPPTQETSQARISASQSDIMSTGIGLWGKYGSFGSTEIYDVAYHRAVPEMMDHVLCCV